MKCPVFCFMSEHQIDGNASFWSGFDVCMNVLMEKLKLDKLTGDLARVGGKALIIVDLGTIVWPLKRGLYFQVSETQDELFESLKTEFEESHLFASLYASFVNAEEKNVNA